MVISTEAGVFKDRFDQLASTIWPAQEGSDDLSSGRVADESAQGREQVPLYRGGKNVTPKDSPPIIPSAPDRASRTSMLDQGTADTPDKAGMDRMRQLDRRHQILDERKLLPPTPQEDIPSRDFLAGHHASIDRDHHVPLLASAIMDDSGNMTGLAIDHRAKLSGEDEDLLHLHESTELPYMNDLVKGGMKPSDAYAEAHKWATARETAASIAKWGQEGHEAYQGRIRAAVAAAKEPSDRDRHPDAHTTRYALDESELGHKPIQIDVLGGGTGLHAGPGSPPVKMTGYKATSPTIQKTLEKADEIHKMTRDFVTKNKLNVEFPANENKIPSDAFKASKVKSSLDTSPLEKTYQKYESEIPREFLELGTVKANYPERYKFYKALLEQRGDEKSKRDLELMKSFENWEESYGITKKLIEKKPMLKSIEGGNIHSFSYGGRKITPDQVKFEQVPFIPEKEDK